jgi:hypothetical protein
MYKLIWDAEDDMPDPSAIGMGAGAGGGVLAFAWIAERLFGRAGTVAAQVSKLYEWHNVADPDDDTQKIWWLSKRIRENIADTRDLIGKLLTAVECQDRAQRELVEIVSHMRDDIAQMRQRMRGDTHGA